MSFKFKFPPTSQFPPNVLPIFPIKYILKLHTSRYEEIPFTLSATTHINSTSSTRPSFAASFTTSLILILKPVSSNIPHVLSEPHELQNMHPPSTLSPNHSLFVDPPFSFAPKFARSHPPGLSQREMRCKIVACSSRGRWMSE